jgi:hypothetical protein
MVCYDLDRFRQFVESPGFQEVHDLPDDLWQKIRSDDTELMLFGFRLLRQVLFNEMSIALKGDAMDRRLARKQERETILDAIAAKVGPVEPTAEDPGDKYHQID